jgi:hypothetical protein
MAEGHLRDGIRLGHFIERDCAAALLLARRCLTASVRLRRSQRRFLETRHRTPRRNRDLPNPS